MVFTLNEFMEIMQFAGLVIYNGFYSLNQAKVISDGGISISLLDIMIGFLALYLITDRVMKYLEGD